ncbi:LysR family transcriptional regulator [Rhizobacter sp. Root404]|uniref:LysR family transcriptional regulator n=1 Tax=Rhizobacter sp. Root404 TaxID=1736528 RepID=UPI0009EADE9B|nr:LysR family transcriptional regulator [Rhizobacter sp. Root404]
MSKKFERDDTPSHSLLPIHELMALEAVARLGSVQRAADALNVTPSGISHRIASLEERVGVELLLRDGRGVALSLEAKAYVDEVRKGLLGLASDTETLRTEENSSVRLATAAAIGASWLLPLLKNRMSLVRRARLDIITVATPDELPPDRWDILIHYGHHPRRGSQRHQLFVDMLIAVCAPQLKRQPGSNSSDASPLSVLRLAQLDARAKDFGIEGLTSGDSHLLFDDALAMLETAASGAGVAISTRAAARPYLDSGRLVLASDVSLAGEKYFADLSEAGKRKPVARDLFESLVLNSHTNRQGAISDP